MQRHDAAGREQQWQQHRERQQQPEQRGAGIAPADEGPDGGLVGRRRNAQREQQERRRRVQRRAQPKREAVQLGHAGQVTDDGDDGQDDRRDHDRDVRAPEALVRPERRNQEGDAEQQKRRGGDRRRAAGEDAGRAEDRLGKEQPIDAEVDTDRVFGYHGGRQQRREERRVPLDRHDADPQRQQARSGEQEQHGGERLGREGELWQRKDTADVERGGNAVRPAERESGETGHEREPADPSLRDIAAGGGRRRPRGLWRSFGHDGELWRLPA